MLHTKALVSASGEDFFYIIPIYTYVIHVTPALDHFWPQGHNIANFVEAYQVKLHTKYQGSRPSGFRQSFMSSLYQPM